MWRAGGRIIIHSEPWVVEGRGAYAQVETFGQGQAIPLVLDGREVAQITWEELLR